MSVLFLLPYPLNRAPSQRFRVEAFLPTLNAAGISFRLHTFLDEAAWEVLYQKGSAPQKAWAVLKGFLGRMWMVFFIAPRYSYVFIHREASPLGPPVFEWLLAKLLRKKLIFDFDDAIWIPNVTESNKAARYVKCFWKISHIIRWSYRISAGNAYLAHYAAKYNKAVSIVPTCVDTDNRFNQLQNQQTVAPVIGWTGSHSTLFYLDAIVPVLRRLEQEYRFTFLVICNQPPAFQLRSLKFMRWNEKTETDDLLQVHIGVMPLVADAWSEGKCGFKIIQYLSLGIPAVASPVGVNATIVEPGTNGFLCATEDEWYRALEELLRQHELRAAMGKAGREKIVAQYSVQANSEKFLSLLHN